jgi:hypothetical protein
MIRALSAAVLLLAIVSLASAQDAKAEGEWIQLFNGKDLTGWTPKIRYCDLGDNYGDTFRVENGVLKVAYDKYDKFGDRFGHLFYNEPFSSYILRVEYRFVGEQCPGGPGWAVRNSGAMLHGESPQTMGKDQDFPASIEVQFLGGSGGVRARRPTSARPGRTSSTKASCTPSTAPTPPRRPTTAISG